LLRDELKRRGTDAFIVAISPHYFDYQKCGYDGLNLNRLAFLRKSDSLGSLERLAYGFLNRTPLAFPRLRSYSSAVKYLNPPQILSTDSNIFPTVVPNWDNSPRTGRKSLILHGSTPRKYHNHLKSVVSDVRGRDSSRQIIFIKSWNEWAEGNYLEPDQRHGMQYLFATKEALVF
jgi:hypothetical protein